ncbi:WecB/TagA/CpsF family glycosyltransferase [Candidatus Uhrbacteria bacterium]|nr:WecB/TagA/CpsF family glycosyltransferase [Candidatus Uhrbacteria bacterium]
MISHRLFGVRIDDLEEGELEQKFDLALQGGTQLFVVTPNPEFLLQARGDQAFHSLLNRADISLPDGVGLIFGIAALTDERLHHRHTGIDALLLIAQECAKNRRRLLLIGSDEQSATLACEQLRKEFSGLEVKGLDPGRIQGNSASMTITDTFMEHIRLFEPDAMGVALGQGKQERFVFEVMQHIPGIRIGIGIGGTLDTLSHKRPRAPKWMRNFGLEWMWRLLIEPRRARRIVRATVFFPILVIWDTLKHRRFLKACRRVRLELKNLFV